MREMGSEYMSLRSTSLLSRPALLLRHSSVIVIIKSYLLLWYIHRVHSASIYLSAWAATLRGCVSLSNADITRLIAPRQRRWPFSLSLQLFIPTTVGRCARAGFCLRERNAGARTRGRFTHALAFQQPIEAEMTSVGKT